MKITVSEQSKNEHRQSLENHVNFLIESHHHAAQLAQMTRYIWMTGEREVIKHVSDPVADNYDEEDFYIRKSAENREID